MTIIGHLTMFLSFLVGCAILVHYGYKKGLRAAEDRCVRFAERAQSLRHLLAVEQANAEALRETLRNLGHRA